MLRSRSDKTHRLQSFLIFHKKVQCTIRNKTTQFDYEPDHQGQITFFAMEVIEALARELNLAGVRPVHAPQRLHARRGSQRLDRRRV